jgi:hypothetical protein
VKGEIMNNININEAIEIINDITWQDNGRYYGKIVGVRNLVNQVLEEYKKQRWIPTSVKLPNNPIPEDGEPEAYLVTINKYAIVPTTLYYLGDGKWTREFDEPSQINTNIFAWKPLPEVYKE